MAFKVIMLHGPGSCGKTTTLTILYNTLIRRGASIISEKKKLGNQPGDFETVLSYMGKKIAIFTMGDLSGEVINAMVKYSNIVDVLIIACNDRFKRPFEWMKLYYSYHLIAKTKGNRLENNEIALEIALLI